MDLIYAVVLVILVLIAVFVVIYLFGHVDMILPTAYAVPEKVLPIDTGPPTYEQPMLLTV